MQSVVYTSEVSIQVFKEKMTYTIRQEKLLRHQCLWQERVIVDKQTVVAKSNMLAVLPHHTFKSCRNEPGNGEDQSSVKR